MADLADEAIRVGLAYGARDLPAIGRAGRMALIVGVGSMMLTAALIWAAPGMLVALYLDLGDAANAAVIAVTLPSSVSDEGTTLRTR